MSISLEIPSVIYLCSIKNLAYALKLHIHVQRVSHEYSIFPRHLCIFRLHIPCNNVLGEQPGQAGLRKLAESLFTSVLPLWFECSVNHVNMELWVSVVWCVIPNWKEKKFSLDMRWLTIFSNSINIFFAIFSGATSAIKFRLLYSCFCCFSGKWSLRINYGQWRKN